MFEKTAAAVTPGMTLCVLTQGTEAKEKTEKALAESSKGNDDEYRCSFVLSEPFSDLGALRSVNGKLYLSHLGKKGNEYLSHPTKPL